MLMTGLMTILDSDMYTILIKRAGTRENGKASYRVVESFYHDMWVNLSWISLFEALAIRSAKPYKSGCFINPAKTLRESGLMR
jgi:hypothetical protein